ncbi:MAG: site-specific DNA-methyltransferase [Burkholderiales bacterium]|nr:site-specific DNA-methyltransferase [Burkholderiales bacterium]
MSRAERKHYELTDAERRDLAKLLDEGKPLPEKYRFILFEDKREVELVWNGKTRDVCTTVLPFQSLEHIDEPRQEAPASPQQDLFDPRGRQVKGWTNKLIWGDNKLVLSSLKSGPLREQIEEAGGLKLIYIDPPFDVGADFSMDIEIGGETFHKEPNILEQIAYRDTWGRGADSFIAMLYERLILMRDLLADNGSIYVHCDWRVNSLVRLALDEVFGRDSHVNQIQWHYKRWPTPAREWQKMHNTLYFYAKEKGRHLFNRQYGERSEETVKRWGTSKIVASHDADGKRIPSDYAGADSQGAPVDDVWDISIIAPSARERLDYPTQKPEALLERIVLANSNQGDLVADFFCGSGTTAAVAEKLGRKWIATDLGKFAVHTTRKRLIGVQRQLQQEGKPFRAFEILNLGRYERQAYINVGGRLSAGQKEAALQEKARQFRELILRAYKAQPLAAVSADPGFFHGQFNGRLVVIGPINLPVGRLFVEEVIVECRKRGASRVDLLAFEFEMGLFPAVLDEARGKGIDLTPKYIPAEVFDKRAVERGQVVFHDISFIEATPRYDKKNKSSVQIELTDFSVYYTQGALEEAARSLKEGKSQVVCDGGQLYKLAKSKDGVVKRERLTRHWTDWVDYWAVDFNYESRKEVIKRPRSLAADPALAGFEPPQGALAEYEDWWTGGYLFENEWQSFRTRQSRELELKTAAHVYAQPGRYKVAVKVIDIFGNDTMTLLTVSVG